MSAPPSAFNPYVHGARGLFCLLVFVFHVINSGLPTFALLSGNAAEHLLRSGKFGVELFFGISGIVIVGALERSPSAGVFLYDRYVRILPVLWASIVVLIALSLAAHRPLPPATDLALNFVAPPPFIDVWLIHPAAWSLGYEFTLYGLCALWALLQRRRGLALAVLAPLALLLLVFHPRALLMVAGILIARQALSGRAFAWLSRYPSTFLLLYLVAWRLLELRGGGSTTRLSPATLPLLEWLGVLPLLLVSAGLGALALLGIERGKGWLSRVLATRSMQWLGTVSYSFYIWHPIVMAVAKGAVRAVHLDGSMFAQLALALLALPPSLLISQVSQRLLEVRVTRLLKSLVRKPQQSEAQLAHALDARVLP